MDIITGEWYYQKQDEKKMKQDTSVTIWKDHEAASIAAAHYFVMLCRQCIAKKGRFTVALSGGNTPKRLYELLASPLFSQNIPWEKVFFFWSDERFVSHTDPESNYRMAWETLLHHIPVSDKNIFAVPVAGEAKAAAKEYEQSILSFWKKKKVVFDCILLGIGEDGHTASLFPGTKILKEKKRLVKEVWLEEKRSWRISFTLPLINNASSLIFLATGKEKAAVLSTILTKKKKKALLPAQMVKPVNGNVSWMLDEEAAAKIQPA